MTHYDRIHLAMTHQKPDRVPVMCQLSQEHMERNGGVRPIEMYYSAEGAAQAFLNMGKLYNFDGILLNTWFSNTWKEQFDKIQFRKTAAGEEYLFPDGRVLRQEGSAFFEATESQGQRYPQLYPGIEDIDTSAVQYCLDYSDKMALHEIIVAEGKSGCFSVHGEVYSPMDNLVVLMGVANTMMALLLDPNKCKTLLEGYVRQNFAFARAQLDVGVDTMKISSPFVGGSFISRKFYAEFVVPFERELVRLIHAYSPGIPVYTHTCGFIGDRLELMQSTGIDGLECMDPPPLGDTLLADAKQRVGKELFLKGNMDSVNVLLHATPETLEEYVRQMIWDGAQGGGYILSSACSVAPGVDPEILKMLVPLAEKYGKYE